jgi:hypothetical protein
MKEKKQKSARREKRCLCPYCEEELVMANVPFCQACSITFYQCPTCQVTVLDREATSCPKCGAPLK